MSDPAPGSSGLFLPMDPGSGSGMEKVRILGCTPRIISTNSQGLKTLHFFVADLAPGFGAVLRIRDLGSGAF